MGLQWEKEKDGYSLFLEPSIFALQDLVHYLENWFPTTRWAFPKTTIGEEGGYGCFSNGIVHGRLLVSKLYRISLFWCWVSGYGMVTHSIASSQAVQCTVYRISLFWCWVRHGNPWYCTRQECTLNSISLFWCLKPARFKYNT